MIQLESLKSQVQTVSGELLPNVPSKEVPLNIEVKHFCSVHEESDGVGVLRLETVVGPTPAALFRVTMSHVITVTWGPEVTIEDIKANAFDICGGLGNQISHLVSVLTVELIGTHIIIPPNLNKEGFILK